jgi:hypothetical protein
MSEIVSSTSCCLLHYDCTITDDKQQCSSSSSTSKNSKRKLASSIADIPPKPQPRTIANTTFEIHTTMYKRFAQSKSIICGLCIVDLFTVFGLTQRNTSKALFNLNISASHAYLVGNRAYKYKAGGGQTPIAVFKKGCLLIPRGEIIYSLLAYRQDDLTLHDEFRIYITTDADFENGDANKTGRYVTLNPNLMCKLRSFRSIEDHLQLGGEYGALVLSLLYVQSVTGLSLLSCSPETLMKISPSNGHSFVALPGQSNRLKNRMSVHIKEPLYADSKDWTLDDKQIKITPEWKPMSELLEPFRITTVTSQDSCVPLEHLKDQYGGLINSMERNTMSRIRHELDEMELFYSSNDSTFPKLDEFKNRKIFDSPQSLSFFKNIIFSTFPKTWKDNDTNEQIYFMKENCIFTELGLVACRDICENDCIIIDETEIRTRPSNSEVNRDCSPVEHTPEYTFLSLYK